MNVRPSTRLVAAGLFTLVLLVSSVASAAGNVMVVEFTGAKKVSLKEQVEKALSAGGVEIVEASSDASGESASAYADVAKEKEITAFVGGHTVMKKSGWTLTLSVRNGADGEVLDEVVIKGSWLPGLKKSIDSDAADKLAPILEKAEAPAEEEPEPEVVAEEEEEAEPEEEEEEEEEDDEDDGPPKKRPSPLDLHVGMRSVSRNLEYNQDVNGTLRTHSVSSPAVFVSGTWYPVAHFTGGVPAHIGVLGHFEQGFLATSKLQTGSDTTYDTSLQSWSVGLKGRIPIAKHEIGISGSYGQQNTEIQGDVDPNSRTATGAIIERDFVPDVAYEFIRPGLDARFQIASFGIGIYGGYRIVTSLGAIQNDEWFPNAEGSGVDAGFIASYDLPADLYLAAAFDFRQFGMSMNSSPSDLGTGTPDPADDRDVAGGATDRYFTGHFGLGWRPKGDE